MAHLIDKYAILAEIESLLDKGKYHEEYDCAYRDGNNGALYALKGKVNSIEVKKEVDLEEEIKEEYLKRRCYGGRDNMLVILNEPEFNTIAKHFFELGLSANNPITATDRGIAEEIIINLKRVEKDYRIDLTKEIEWVRNQVKKGEDV